MASQRGLCYGSRMVMNGYAIFILGVLLAGFALETVTDLLNLKNLGMELPREFEGVIEKSRYETSLRYQAEGTRFEMIRRTVTLVFTVLFIFLGGFNAADQLARSPGGGMIVTGLLFLGLLGLIRTALNLPFSIYDTFVIEEKYGFNRTTPRTFVTDLFKGTILSVLIGGPILALLLYFFVSAGPLAWLYAWIALTGIQIILLFLAPAFILPLFNKFEPLAAGELRSAIERYASAQNFTLSGIYRMDSSKRSTKSNAFFTGFGRFRRLVLFDTLIERQTVEELVAVVAHEVGHFKRKHILKSILLSIASTGFVFYFLSFFLENRFLFEAFGMRRISVYASLVFVGFLYSPVARVLGVLTHWLSRKHEFEADAFAVHTFARPEVLISALKKLSVDNLSHLTPHPVKVWLDYTHPPIVTRIHRIAGH